MLNHEELSSRSKTITFIISVIALAYAPLWTSVFSLKNDFYTQYFLNRFFIGESIHSWQFPLWNPYFNYGLPVYNDMNGGFWYPATWLNGLLTGYSAYSFALEETLHFPIAAAGFYLLAKKFKLQQAVCVISAISYACSGYFVAHIQHYNWITGAAWLPFCILALYRCIDKVSLFNLCLGGISFSLFISSSHPGLIIGGLYFFMFMALIYLYEKGNWIRSGKNLLFLLGLVMVSMAGLIFSYAEIIPLFTRSGKTNIDIIRSFSTPPEAFFSFLLPLPYAQTEPRWGEITMNNLYLGLLIISAVIAGITKNRKTTDLFYLAVASFFFLISTNTSISLFFISKFPLLQYVRLNGEMRIFGMLALIIYGSLQLDHLLSIDKIRLRNISALLAFALFCTILFILFRHQETAPNIGTLILRLFETNNREALKQAIHSIGFFETAVLQSIIQCLLLLLFCVALMRKYSWLKWIVAADLIMATLLNMPFTGVSMRPVKDIQALLNKSPAGFPLPSTGPEKDIYEAYPHTETLTGNWSFYGKEIAIDEWAHYPMILQTTRNYFDSAHSTLKKEQKSFVFTEKNNTVKLDAFSPDYFDFKVNTITDDRLIVKQNLYPGWKFRVNNQKASPDTMFYSFPVITLKKGENTVTMQFKKPLVTILFLFYSILLFGMTTVLLTAVTKRFYSR